MSYLPRRTVNPLRHRAAQKSAFQRRVVLQGVQGGAGGILLLKQAKQCAAAAREQDACGPMLLQQLRAAASCQLSSSEQSSSKTFCSAPAICATLPVCRACIIFSTSAWR